MFSKRYFLLFFLALALLPSCKKTEVAYPDVTHEWKDIVAFRVNGKPFVMSGNTSNYHTYGVGITYLPSGLLSIGASNYDNHNDLWMNVRYDKNISSYALDNDSLGGNYNDAGLTDPVLNTQFFTDSLYKGVLNITYFQDHICAGTFQFDAINMRGDRIHVTDGRFDITTH